ncbi:arad-like aldolase/epimerase [Eremomyces bilateralis CBS 781.70]|uniref:Arad-like aldolase/epimerase n=1 Tax=Eremomyces bilateralis CBS 781.70 TaxID=1392243 RepID=A0A6G1G6Q3_9PEZI|nr:arad-like aldolase/epimerase [Eremomyces bilateralis CBS 781.70]KAF1813765.1 arad-like aldolase/epimerase [Eremomyces bilateralis CBS 781.70]
MSPPAATQDLGIDDGPTVSVTVNPGVKQERVVMPGITGPLKFDDPYKERDYLKGRLAAAFRIFGKFGFDEGVAGHITVRDPVDKTSFWVNPMGISFNLIKKSDLLLVSHEGKVIDGGECRLLNSAAFMIHSAVHEARPDVNAAAHSHSIYGRSFCTLGRTLDCITQDSCAFYEDHVLYSTFNGVVLAEKEGKDIAATLGTAKAALLQNHGLLTAGGTIEEAVFWFVSMDRCCHAQLLADAAAGGRGGATVKIGHEEAMATYRTVGTPMAGYFSAKPLFDVIHKETNGDYLQ